MFGSIRRALFFLEKKIAPEAHARRLGVRMGRGCRLINVDFSSEPYLVTFGDRVSATSTRFETHDGGVWVFRQDSPDIDVVRPILIGSNVFIGYGSIILPGVTIGDDVVIGAGSVVARDIPSGCVAAGVPARVIKSISEYKIGVLDKSDSTKGMSILEKRRYFTKKYMGETF